MILPDGSVLMHEAAPYDPAKAHEYYMKTRKLKGRHHGGSYTVKTGGGHTVVLSGQKLVEQKAYAAHRVEALKKDLSDLAVILRNKIEEAKKSSKPPTLAEKAKAAREAEQYRKSHKQELQNKAKAAAAKKAPSSSSSSAPKAKTDTVDSLKADITKTKANLKAAVAKQRELATAKKNG
jgi:hypothetical protein